jgi:hypothetical protein
MLSRYDRAHERRAAHIATVDRLDRRVRRDRSSGVGTVRAFLPGDLNEIAGRPSSQSPCRCRGSLSRILAAAMVDSLILAPTIRICR